MANPFEGLTVVAASIIAAAVVVVVWRRFRLAPPLEGDATFVTNTYPIVGLIYGVFLGFTIVITWGHFRDAETSTTQEVTRLSGLWRDVEVLPEEFRGEMRCGLYRYAREVVVSDWDSMAVHGAHSPEATQAYEEISPC